MQSFQSAPPRGGRRRLQIAADQGQHVSIRAPRVGGDVDGKMGGEAGFVSIRAPRVGGDVAEPSVAKTHEFVSIRAPRVGGDR